METIIFTFKKNLAVLLFFSAVGMMFAQRPDIIIDPNQRYQEIEGWGSSLAWWAGVVGDFPDEEIENLTRELIDPNELNMNIWKYNIHGGDNPVSHSPNTERTLPDGSITHLRWESLPMTTYKAGMDEPYNWEANANQRKILRSILEKDPDAILEAISYSPPYWMTYSGCSAGNLNAEPNLKEEYVEVFADFLTDIVKHYHDEFGITFRTLAPINEANTNFWVYGGRQEGCTIELSTQAKIFNSVYNQLEEKEMLSYCTMSGADDTSINSTKRAFDFFRQDEDLISKFSQMATHSYGGGVNGDIPRSGLSDIAQKYNLRFWQSEVGGNNAAGGFQAFTWQAFKIIEELGDMHANAWIDWQIVSGGPWGLYDFDVNENRNGISSTKLVKNKQYYSRKQFSKYIKKGYRIIRSEDGTTLSALSPDNSELVIVTLNRTKEEISKNMDISRFASTADMAKVVRTSNTENTAELADVAIVDGRFNYTAPAESVTTFIIPVSVTEPYAFIPEGIYRIKAKHSEKYISVDGFSNANGATLSQFEFVDQENLEFLIERQGYSYTIRPVYNGTVLTIGGRSLSNGGRLIQFQDVGNDNQRFHMVKDDEEGFYKILNKNSDLYLAVAGESQDNGASIVQFQDFDTDNFKWSLEPVATEPVIPSGFYKIRGVNSNAYMTTVDNGIENGTLLRAIEDPEVNPTVYEFTIGSDGYYQLRPDEATKLISIDNESGKAILFTNLDEVNQKFSIIEVGDGEYRFGLKSNRARTLGILQTGKSNGTIVSLGYADADYVKWVLEPFDPVLSVDNVAKIKGITLYPNPTNGTLYVKNQNDFKIKIVAIYNISGVKVQEIKDIKNASTIDLDTKLASGVYLIEISNGIESVWDKTVLKR